MSAESPKDGKRRWGGRGRSLPAVATTGREQRQQVERRVQIGRAVPSFVVAALLHVVAFVLLSLLPGEPDGGLIKPLEIRSTVLETEEWTPPSDDDLDDTPQDPEEVLPDPVASEESDLDEPPGLDVLGVGGGFGGGGGGTGGGLVAAPSETSDLGLGGGASPFQQFVIDLRGRGLDVVFVVDATASMGPFIAAARATIDDIIVDLATVVPSLRLGLVAYRDADDAWISRHVDLSDDRYQIQNFLLDLDAVGGGDFPEAVDVGVTVAAEQLAWRAEARRVIILVGDAPPHEDRVSPLLSTIRRFARDDNSLVNVLYTGTADGLGGSDRMVETRKSMERIAKTGRGLVADLGEGGTDLRQRITDASFGTQWRDDIARLLGQTGVDPKVRIIEKKVERRQREWFVRNITRQPVHPALVEGYLELLDGPLASKALAMLEDESLPMPLRSCALYILKKGVDAASRVDLTAPLAGQVPPMARLRRLVNAMDTSGGGPKPVPNAPPGLPPNPPPTPPR